MTKYLRLTLLGAAAFLLAAAQPAESPSAVTAAPTYADLADLALPAPVVAHVELRRAVPLRPSEAVGVAAGYSRFYVEAQVQALLRGEPATSSAVSYVVDLPNLGGRPAPPQRRSAWLVFARPVAGAPGGLQLVASDAQIPFTAEVAERVRAILRAGVANDAPPPIVGIGRAFNVPGALPGSGETQLFLQTSRDQPVSITIAREAGMEPQWFVSLSEFVDAGRARPQRDTLLWYRLACFLPARLPAASLVDAAESTDQINADYRLVREGLGPCPRNRARR